MNDRTIGKSLRMLRKLALLSQAQLADICNISQESIADYELDKSEPRIDTLHRMLRFFDVRFAQFFAFIDGAEDPGRLPREADFSIEDAVLTVRAKLGMTKVRHLSLIRTIRKDCQKHNVDWLAFWQLLDAHIEPRRL